MEKTNIWELSGKKIWKRSSVTGTVLVTINMYHEAKIAKAVC